MNPMNQPPDDDLREWLREQGNDTAHRAPAFQRVWRGAREEAQAAPTQASSSLWSKWALAACAVIVVGFATTLLIPQPDKNDAPKPVIVARPMPPSADVFDPSAPTDFLLADHHDSTVPSVDQLSREINALLKP